MSARTSGLRREGASLSRAELGDRARAWLQHHRLSAADSLARVLENLFSSVLICLVIGIALALPAGLSLAIDSIERVAAAWDTSARLSVFLDATVPADQAAALESELRSVPEVQDTLFVSRAQSLDEFSRVSGLADVLASLDSNPLPDLILVTPRDGLQHEAIAALRDRLQAMPGVTEAVLDMDWLQRLHAAVALGRRVVLVAGGLLGLGALFILGNTVHLAIESRRDEIVVVKLVGGSNAFVRRPFLYTGLWYGVGGGAVACALVAAALWSLRQPVEQLAALYGGSVPLHGPGLMGALNLVVLGGVLGLVGAWLGVTRHLVQIAPR